MNLRSGTRVPLTTPIKIPDNPKCTRSIAIQNASSPLLALPGEVKNRIYELTLGSHVIHLLQNTPSATHTHSTTIPLSHRTCRALLTESEAQEAQDAATPSPTPTHPETDEETPTVWNVGLNQDRHRRCYPHTTQSNAIRTQHQIPLSFLRVCRQIWNESKAVPYAKNTFAFNCPTMMERFIRERVKHKQHLLIRSIFLDIGMDHPDLEALWTIAITKAVSKKLTGLTRLHVGFEQVFCMCWISACAYGERKGNSLYEAIGALGGGGLKEVSVVVCDGHWLKEFRDYGDWEEREELFRWGLGEKQVFSREMRRVLLGVGEEGEGEGEGE